MICTLFILTVCTLFLHPSDSAIHEAVRTLTFPQTQRIASVVMRMPPPRLRSLLCSHVPSGVTPRQPLEPHTERHGPVEFRRCGATE